MNIFRFISWKAVAGVMPILLEVFKHAKEYVGGGENPEIEELKQRVKHLQFEQESIFRFIKTAVACLVILFIISLSALVLGIIALSR
ncbi:MAG: hypothetical protein ACYC5N_09230 [Endomicrobiales bacterium]